MGSESLSNEDGGSSDEDWLPLVEKGKELVKEKGVNRSNSDTTKKPTKKAKLSETTTENKEGPSTSQEQAESQEENQEKSSKYQRRQITCPLFSCKAKVIHLPRHMQKVHHWTKQAASKVLSKFNIRKRKDKESKSKDYHSRCRCPLSDCHSVVQRLPAHLKKVHKLVNSSEEYSNAMKNAAVVPNNKHPIIRWQEERFKTKEWKGRGESRPFAINEKKALSEEEKDQEDEELDCDERVDISSDDDDSDGDDEVEENECQIPTRVKIPPLLLAFEEWFESPDGGKRDLKTVKQHSAQLSVLLKVIDNEDVKSLLDVKLVRQEFLSSYVKSKNYQPATIKSYLMSLRHFYSFLLSDSPDGIEFNVDEVNAAREKVKLWSASYKREANTRKWQKLEEDTMNRLTPENIRSFEKSETAREVVKIIGEHSDTTRTTVLTQQSYTLVRDFLFTQIFIDKANRPGVLSEMTMQEYSKMTKESDHYVIKVLKHKTAHVHGPARIVLNSKLKSWLAIFVGIMRPQIASTTSGNVFLSWNGRKMKSGDITKAVQSVFKKSRVEVKVMATSFRKATVTKVHLDNPALIGKLARHMAHREGTATEYYLMTKKAKESVEASKMLGSLMRCNDKNQECNEEMAGNSSEGKGKEDSERVGNKKMAEKSPERFRESKRSL